MFCSWHRYAALAAKWKEPAKDALDTLILGAVDVMSLGHMELLEHMPFDPVVKRLVACMFVMSVVLTCFSKNMHVGLGQSAFLVFSESFPVYLRSYCVQNGRYGA